MHFVPFLRHLKAVQASGAYLNFEVHKQQEQLGKYFNDLINFDFFSCLVILNIHICCLYKEMLRYC